MAWDGTVLLNGDRPPESSDRAQEYDRALKQSQYVAARRRQGSVLLAGSAGGTAVGSSSIFHSAAGLATAQTAVLGDSQGSVAPPLDSGGADLDPGVEDDTAPDGSVASGLGGSYVDGTAKRGSLGMQGVEEEGEDGLEDGGVLGLLAQIYGVNRSEGRAGVI
jgi:autophagy-related protein 9